MQGLCVQRQVDFARSNVDVLQEKSDLRRQVTGAIPSGNLLTNVDQFNVAYFTSIFIVLQSLYKIIDKIIGKSIEYNNMSMAPHKLFHMPPLYFQNL